MSFWYSKPNEGEQFAQVGNSDWLNAKTTFEFSELVFRRDENWNYIFANATTFTDIRNYKDDNWQFSEGLIRFKLSRKTTYKVKDKERFQSGLERLLDKLLDTLDDTLVYSGYIDLTNSPLCDKASKEDNLTKYEDIIFKLEVVTADKIPVDTINKALEASGKKAYGTGFSRASEKDRLQDRVDFITTQIGMITGVKTETLFDAALAFLSLDNETEKDLISQWLMQILK